MSFSQEQTCAKRNGLGKQKALKGDGNEQISELYTTASSAYNSAGGNFLKEPENVEGGKGDIYMVNHQYGMKTVYFGPDPSYAK